MQIAKIGLALNFLAALSLGFSTQFGLAIGFGGPFQWKNRIWRVVNIVGWVLLAVGFLFQWSACDVLA